jgi:hypothetical protein
VVRARQNGPDRQAGRGHALRQAEANYAGPVRARQNGPDRQAGSGRQSGARQAGRGQVGRQAGRARQESRGHALRDICTPTVLTHI